MPPKKVRFWACPSCTLHNPSSRKRCTACNTPRCDTPLQDPNNVVQPAATSAAKVGSKRKHKERSESPSQSLKKASNHSMASGDEDDELPKRRGKKETTKKATTPKTKKATTSVASKKKNETVALVVSSSSLLDGDTQTQMSHAGRHDTASQPSASPVLPASSLSQRSVGKAKASRASTKPPQGNIAATKQTATSKSKKTPSSRIIPRGTQPTMTQEEDSDEEEDGESSADGAQQEEDVVGIGAGMGGGTGFSFGGNTLPPAGGFPMFTTGAGKAIEVSKEKLKEAEAKLKIWGGGGGGGEDDETEPTSAVEAAETKPTSNDSGATGGGGASFPMFTFGNNKPVAPPSEKALREAQAKLFGGDGDGFAQQQAPDDGGLFATCSGKSVALASNVAANKAEELIGGSDKVPPANNSGGGGDLFSTGGGNPVSNATDDETRRVAAVLEGHDEDVTKPQQQVNKFSGTGGGMRLSGMSRSSTGNVALGGIPASSNATATTGKGRSSAKFKAPKALHPAKTPSQLVDPCRGLRFQSETPGSAVRPSTGVSGAGGESLQTLKKIEFDPAAFTAAEVPLTAHSASTFIAKRDTDFFEFPAAAAGPTLKELLHLQEGEGVITADHYRKALLTLGALPKGCTYEWVENHAKMALWRHANSLQSSATAGGVSPIHVLANLVSRYNIEYVSGVRSALRMITEQDAQPTGCMILAITDVLKPAEGQMHKSVIGVTDGWYVLNVLVDVQITSDIRSGRYQPGSKILVCGTKSSISSAAPPLEVPQETTHLEMCHNGTFEACPDAPLGFAVPPADPNKKGRARPRAYIPVSKIHNIIQGGGSVPCVVGKVVRVLPTYYLNKSPDGTSVWRNALAESIASNAFQRDMEDAYEKEAAVRGREAAAELIRGKFQRQVNAVRTIMVADETGLILVQSFGDAGGVDGDVAGGVKEGQVIRVFNVAPSNYASLPYPFSGCRMFMARPRLMCAPVETHETENPPLDQAAVDNIAVPYTSALHTLEDLEAIADRATRMEDEGGLSTTPVPLLVDIVGVALRLTKLDANKTQLLFCDPSKHVFGALTCCSYSGKELELPSLSHGDVFSLTACFFIGVNKAGSFDVVHFGTNEYTTVAVRPSASRFGAAVATLTSQKVGHGIDVSGFPNELMAPAIPAVTVNRPITGSSTDVSPQRMQPLGVSPLPVAPPPPPLALNSTFVAPTIAPKRTLFNPADASNGRSSGRPSGGPLPVPVLAPLSSGVAPVHVLPPQLPQPVPVQSPQQQPRGALDQPQPLPAAPPIPSINVAPTTSSATRHLFGNVLPNTLEVLQPRAFPLVAATTALQCEVMSDGTSAAVEGDSQLGSKLHSPTKPPASKIAIKGRFLYQIGQDAEVSFPATELLETVGDLCHISNAVASDDAFELAMSRGHLLRGQPLEQQWAMFLHNSCVIPAAVFTSFLTASSGSLSQDSPKLGFLNDQLRTLRRWNATTVPHRKVLWWHEDEFIETQHTIQQTLSNRLFKISVNSSDVVTRIFTLCEGVSVENLYVE